MTSKPESTTSFSEKILSWFDIHGRKDLPWQINPTAYRVWVSEIMLQQTQVSTVVPYYHRFMERFPNIQALADSPLDDVLHHWSGLGYYARARNLHKSALIIHGEYAGSFPDTVEAITALPGIGRSTAGAILALAMNKRFPILDGNVKRVLSRYCAIQGWPDQPAVFNELWQVADKFTPHIRVAAYTQAMMDLGATVCTRSTPACDACPLGNSCKARINGLQSQLPGRKPKKILPVRKTQMLVIQNATHGILLEKRPDSGIWGGLWSLPECENHQEIMLWYSRNFGGETPDIRMLGDFRHTFSHFHLDITPILITVDRPANRVMEAQASIWYNAETKNTIGLAAPVKKIINQAMS